MVTVALAGNPNAGKTTLFNALTGENAFVGNWPGVTVAGKEGRWTKDGDVRFLDLPGVYSLAPYTPEEAVTRDALLLTPPDAILNVVDGTGLERNLYLTTQLLALGLPLVVAVSRMDLLERRGQVLDLDALSARLGCPVVGTSSGADLCAEAVLRAAGEPPPVPPDIFPGEIKAHLNTHRPQWEEKIAACRYAFTEEVTGQVLKGNSPPKGRGPDRILLNRFAALPIFALVLLGMFWFSIRVVGGWTEGLPWPEHLRNMTAGVLRGLGVSPVVQSMVLDGVLGGVGTVLGFLPQLTALFLCLTFLEGCGYLARGAYLLDRAARPFGLSGKSVVPYVLACGCGVPGVLACRTIRREGCRKLTILTATFLPCGAKLPVIALIAGTVFPNSWYLAPCAYLAGVGAVLLTGWLLSGTKGFPKGEGAFLMELPDYRLPGLEELLRGAFGRVLEFLKKAASLVLLASVAVWFAASFGWQEGAFGFLAGGALENSLLAALGKQIAPFFAPLGWGDWPSAVAAVTGLLAKESIVSTLAVLCPGGLPEMLLVPPAALSFLLFNLLCAPCLAAMSAIRQEMGSGRDFLFAILYQTGFAWFAALAVYQIGVLFFGR